MFDPNGQPQVFNRGRINWWGRSEDWADKLGFRGPQDVESPGLEWTHIEAVVSGNRLQYFVNGKLVNEGTDSSFTEGKIMIQSEGAEIYFRRIDSSRSSSVRPRVAGSRVRGSGRVRAWRRLGHWSQTAQWRQGSSAQSAGRRGRRRRVVGGRGVGGLESPGVRLMNVAEPPGCGSSTAFADPEEYFVESVPGGVAVFDYNGDGRPDIFFTNGAKTPALDKVSPIYSNRLYRNDGGMRFTDVTSAAGLSGHRLRDGAAAGDFDNDGHVDMFVAGVRKNQLYHNRGDGRFADVTAGAGSGAATSPSAGAGSTTTTTAVSIS